MPVIESTSSNFALGGTSIAVTTPSGTVDGDLLLAFGASRNGAATAMTASGWTNDTSFDHSAGGPGGSLLFKIAASEGASTTFSFTSAGGGNVFCLVLRISGFDPTNPINASVVSSEFNTSTNQDPRIHTDAGPDVATTVDGCLILRAIVASVNGVMDRSGPSTYYATTQLPSGVTVTLQADENDPVASQSTDEGGGAIFSQDALQTSAGLTGTASMSVDLDDANTSQGVRAFGMTIAIAPGAFSSGFSDVPDLEPIKWEYFSYYFNEYQQLKGNNSLSETFRRIKL